MKHPAGAPGRAVNGAQRLDRLAAAAAKDLGAHGVIVTQCHGDDSPSVAAVTGVTHRRALQLLPELAARERQLDRGATSLPTAEADAGAAFDAIERIMSAPAEVGGRRVGGIHLLCSTSSVADIEPLVRAYAAHVAVALAASEQNGDLGGISPALVGALGDLSLNSWSWPEFIGGLERELAAEFGPVLVGLMLWQGELDALQMVPGSFGADRGTAASYRIVISNSQSNAARVFASGYPYLSNSARGDAGILQDYVHSLGVERLMSVPVVVGERRVGVLHVANKTEDFTLDDLWRLEALVPQVARSILISKRQLALRRRWRLEGVLSAVAVAIAGGKSVRELLSPALDDLTRAIDVDLVALVRSDAEPIVWRAGSARVEGEDVVLADAGRHPDFGTVASGPHSAHDPGTTLLHIPVHQGTHRVGTLSTLRRRAEPFAIDERDALMRLAKLVALAWATERSQQQRAELARVVERNRIADDLHDDVAQLLFAAQLPLEAALDSAGLDAGVAAEIEQARSLLGVADEALRGAIHHLSRHSSDLGSELFVLASEVERDFGLPVQLEIGAEVEQACQGLRRPAREALVRFVREALVNAAKHAGPCQARVTVGCARRGRLCLSVRDDGIGMRIDGEDGGHGIGSLGRSIRRQGGTLQIDSEPSVGTTLRVSMPL